MSHITKALVEKTDRPAQGQIFIWDDAQKGFGLRVTWSGWKGFVLQTRIRGRVRRITIKGQYPDLSVAQARHKAIQLKAAILNGDDPSAEHQHDAPTFGDLATAYLKNAEVRKLKSLVISRRQLDLHTKRWNTRRATDVSRDDIARLHAKLAEERGPVLANRVATLIRTVFNYAIDRGLFKNNNPASRVKLFKETARTRFLTTDELARINAALAAEPNIYWRSFFPLLLLLGPRRGELQAARWQDVDLTAGVWRVQSSKTGRENLLPMPDAARALFVQLHALSGTGEWVFPSTGKTQHLIEPRRAWKRICDRAGVTGVTVHDLRRTLGSWLASNGQSLPTIGRVLGHQDPNSTAIYSRLAIDSIRRALEDNATRMLGARVSNDVGNGKHGANSRTDTA